MQQEILGYMLFLVPFGDEELACRADRQADDFSERSRPVQRADAQLLLDHEVRHVRAVHSRPARRDEKRDRAGNRARRMICHSHLVQE